MDATSLKKLDIRKMDFTKAYAAGGTKFMFNNVPRNVLIYVKDQTVNDFFKEMYDSTLTNIQIVNS